MFSLPSQIRSRPASVIVEEAARRTATHSRPLQCKSARAEARPISPSFSPVSRTAVPLPARSRSYAILRSEHGSSSSRSRDRGSWEGRRDGRHDVPGRNPGGRARWSPTGTTRPRNPSWNREFPSPPRASRRRWKKISPIALRRDAWRDLREFRSRSVDGRTVVRRVAR